MTSEELKIKLEESGFEGEIWQEEEKRLLFATDASIYKMMPLLVVFPSHKEDIKVLIRFASQNKIPVIPRGTGTSLAGQVVGKAIIADISKHFKKILEINTEEKYAVVQPGVIRDELNAELERYGLMFGPETSTSNRATIGGMF
jgi:FAD/FMN-containing dehydrogenase